MTQCMSGVRYAAIVVDEAHERTTNLDVLLGILHGQAHRFPALKVSGMLPF
jgi:HrpA-like RNA helicase